MKKLILALTGAAVAASPLIATAAEAAPYSHNRHGQQVRNDRNNHGRFAQARKWQRGQRFDRRYASNYRVISNPYTYHLRAAPRGYRWVQSGNDAVLIAITSGIIGAIIANAF